MDLTSSGRRSQRQHQSTSMQDMTIDVNATIEAGAPLYTARRPVPPLIQRAPYVGRVRKHVSCQTDLTETGELKEMRVTAMEAQQVLSAVQEQIEAAASTTHERYAERLQERVDTIQHEAHDRMQHVEQQREDALVRARAAAGAERVHDLVRMRAEHKEAVKLLRGEYEVEISTICRSQCCSSPEVHTFQSYASAVGLVVDRLTCL
eukprot:SAG31_NODE_3526_length_4156_cov_1.726645_2_plen_206_part_00